MAFWGFFGLAFDSGVPHLKVIQSIYQPKSELLIIFENHLPTYYISCKVYNNYIWD